MSNNKTYRGILRNYQFHHLTMAPAEIDIIKKKWPEVDYDAPLRMVTGWIVDDPSGRLPAGCQQRTSLVVSYDEETGFLETIKSTYHLEEPGDVFPDLGNGVLNIFY